MHTPVFAQNLLINKVALVTGGGTGIGTAIVRDLVWQGATVVIASRKESHITPAVAGLSAELGQLVYGKILDIRDREACSRVVAEILAEHKSLDILVNNGGGQFLTPAELIPGKGWDAVVQTNLTGTWNLTRAAADGWMLDHGGRVISITMLTERGFPGMAHSVAARAGVEAMTRTLAIEWAARNVQLSCVAPGLIASNGMKNYPDGVNMAREIQRSVPVKRLGVCEDVSRMVAFLAGPGGNYITGQTFVVDGGASLWGAGWPIPDPEPMPEVILPVEPWEKTD